jgi:hypothetical protein
MRQTFTCQNGFFCKNLIRQFLLSILLLASIITITFSVFQLTM